MRLSSRKLKELIIEEIIAVYEIEDVFGNKEQMILDDEPSQEYKTEEAIKTFQKYYRSLDTDTRYFFSKWLRSALIKELSYEEGILLSSKLSSAEKGYSEPKNPNKK